MIPKDTADQFEAAKQQVITMHAKWKLLEQLFAKSKERSDFLSRTGAGFFAFVQDSMINDIVIALGRLLEKPKVKGNHNLVLERIRELISEPENEDLLHVLDAHLSKAREAYQAVRQYRDKRLAHNDLTTILNEKPTHMKPPAVRDMKTAIGEAGEFLNKINLHYCKTTIAFGLVSMQGDADTIVGLIRDGLAFREAKYNTGRTEAGLDSINWSIPDDP